MSYCGDLEKKLTKAREEINGSARNSLGWYRGAMLWNATATEIASTGNIETFKDSLAPTNAEMTRRPFPTVVIPDFDMAQVLRRLN